MREAVKNKWETEAHAVLIANFLAVSSVNMSLPTEKITELKQIIHSQLNQVWRSEP